MRNYRDLSIRNKLYVIIMFTSGVGLLLASSAFLAYDLFAFRQGMTRDLSILARVIGQESTAALAFNDAHSATQTLSALKANPNIVSACIYASDGKMFASYVRTDSAQTADVLGSELSSLCAKCHGRIDARPASDFSRPHTTGSAFRPRRLDLYQQIVLDGQVVGAIYLASDLDEMYARLARYAGIVLVIAVMSFLLIFPLASKLQQGISKPILHLAETARKVSAEHDYAMRAIPNSRDELGQLTVGFNEMLAQIEDQDQRLRQHREHLEEEVGARTAELRALNTQLARAEEKAAEERNLLRTLIDTVPDNVFFKDTEHRILIDNPAHRRLLGAPTQEEVAGKTDADFFAPELAAQYRADELAVLQSGQALLNREEPSVDPQGNRCWLLTSKVPLRDRLGRIVGLVGINRDITRRKQAEQARAVLASIVECSQDAIIGHTRDGKIASWNRGAEVLFGYRSEEVIGKPVSMLVAEDRSDEWGQNLAKLESGEVLSRIEGVGVRKDGSKLEVSISMSPIVDEAGQVTASSAIVHDITERKRAEREMLLAKEKAEEASRIKSEFLANMSHEIRTPMNGIIGMTELALDTDLKPEQREFLNMVKASAGSLLRVINDILDFSKIEAGKLELDHVEFNLGDCLGDTLKALALRAHQKGLELAGEVSPEVPEAVRGDPTRLRQILVNLIGNAVKFTERGEVLVKVEKQAQTDQVVTLRFTVKDTGIGIPADKQQKIFEPFTQADGSMTRKYGGTGLGLAIASNLVKAMGGQIGAESRSGEGSTFYFTVVLSSCAKPLENLPRAEVATLQGMPVLVVDDNATNRRILEEMLIRWRMLPALAEGGWTALAALERARASRKPFPLILVDAQMPGMDGFQLAERIRQNPALVGSVIMMLTSAGQPGDAARCRALGIVAYLIKPIRQSELLDAILLALGKAAEKAPAPPLITRHSLREAKPKLRVLLAEDNAVNRELVVRWLNKWGYAVVSAHNGREALEAWEESSREGAPFDLILMDVQMPGMDGLEATAVIRSREKETGQHFPIVALTAHAMKGDRERCLAAGMDAYLSKPLQPGELLDTLEHLTAASVASPSPALEEGIPVFDAPEALARVDGDARLLAELAGLFLAECPRLLASVQKAVERRDARALERAAHALKGSVANFSARTATEAARRLEMLGRQGDLAPAGQALGALEDEIERLQAQLGLLAKGVPQ